MRHRKVSKSIPSDWYDRETARFWSTQQDHHEIKCVVEEQMRLDDKTTAHQLQKGYSISLRTILRCRTALGWTFRGSAYCQLIREANKTKILAWAQQHLHSGFEDAIWSDECTVQMESHRRFECRKRCEAPRPKPR